jgi:hypothetical protein
VTELTYPAFPKRALVAAGAALVVLCAVAVVVNRSGPDVRACTGAAARMMSARNYSVAAMTRLGPGRVPACRGLSAGQYARAVGDAYAADYARTLPRAPASAEGPSPSFRALSAQTASRKR